MRNNFSIIVLIFLISGCASTSNNIDATYIPPIKYKNYNCHEIKKRLDDVCQRANRLGQIQNNSAVVDAFAVSSVVIHPLLPVMLMSGGGNEKEISLLKGEIIALQQNAIEKNCSDVKNY